MITYPFKVPINFLVLENWDGIIPLSSFFEQQDIVRIETTVDGKYIHFGSQETQTKWLMKK